MLDVMIIGAGPAGLACAIAAQQEGLSALTIDKGSVVDAIRRFPTGMTFFSTSDVLEIGDVAFISSSFRPTRTEAVRYYMHVARSKGLPIEVNQEGASIRKHGDAFVIEAVNGRRWEARNVVVATGYFDTPRPFTVPGSDLPKVRRVYDEPYAYAGQRVALVGGRNSVVDAALELYREGVDVTIIHRGPALSEGVKYWLLPDIVNRLKAGQIRGFFNTTVKEVTEKSLILEGDHAGELPNDILFVMIGYTIDPALLHGAGVRIDPDSRIPLHDPETFETNVAGLFVAGSIAAGNMNNKIFIENGRLHGRAIVKAIAARISGLKNI